MTAKVLDGKAIAGEIQQEVAEQVQAWAAVSGRQPCLAAVLVGDDPASQVYVRNKQRACARVGLDSQLHVLASDATEDQILDLVGRMNADGRVHGILVQLPLPTTIDTARVLDAIDPLKDVDAFHPENVGLLVQGRPRFLPCTPHGIQQLLYRCRIPVAGKHVVIIGRSDIVGKPLGLILVQRTSPLGRDYCNGTVTICHSRTEDLGMVCRQADILVAAIGQPRFVTAEMVQEGATVIDVGINRTADGLVGDVDFEAVRQVAGHITPVPRGVGPLTVSMLLHNTLIAARAQTV